MSITLIFLYIQSLVTSKINYRSRKKYIYIPEYKSYIICSVILFLVIFRVKIFEIL